MKKRFNVITRTPFNNPRLEGMTRQWLSKSFSTKDEAKKEMNKLNFFWQENVIERYISFDGSR